MKSAQHGEIFDVIGASCANWLQMMNIDPAVFVASLALVIDVGATAPSARQHSVALRGGKRAGGRASV